MVFIYLRASFNGGVRWKQIYDCSLNVNGDRERGIQMTKERKSRGST